MSLPMMKDLFQVGYVTNDLERAAAVMRDQFGTGAVKIMRDIPDSFIDIGLCFAGETNFEIIQSHNASGDFYSDWIADCDGFALRPHHFGFLIPSSEEMSALRGSHRNAGRAFPLDNIVPGFIDVFYADTRGELGHYLEYFYLEAGARAMFADVEGTTIS